MLSTQQERVLATEIRCAHLADVRACPRPEGDHSAASAAATGRPKPARMPPAAQGRAVRRFDARHPDAQRARIAAHGNRDRGRRAHLRVLDRAAHVDEIAVPDDQPGRGRWNGPRHRHRCRLRHCPVSGEHQRPRGQDRGRRHTGRHQPAPPVRDHRPAHVRLERHRLGRRQSSPAAPRGSSFSSGSRSPGTLVLCHLRSPRTGQTLGADQLPLASPKPANRTSERRRAGTADAIAGAPPLGSLIMPSYLW